MNLIVGENTYMTVEDADQLVSDFLVSTDPMRVYWESLSDEDKATIIYSNTQKYDNDNMMYKWFKKEAEQQLQFPRIDIKGKVIEVPTKIKLGLLMNGIKSAKLAKDSDYTELKEQGIKTYKIKDAEVQFFDGNNSVTVEGIKDSSGLYKEIFDNYFKEFTVLV